MDAPCVWDGSSSVVLSTEELASHGHTAVGSTNYITGQARLSCDLQNVCTGVFTCDTSLGSNGRGSTGGSNTTLNINSSFYPSITVGAAGLNQKHENRAPYETVQRWKRTD